MNRKLYCIGALLTGVIRSWGSSIVGGDDFNDNVLDPVRWGPGQSLPGASLGSLTEVNGRLEFSSSVANAFVWRPWVLGQGSYVEDWAVQIDTAVTTTAGIGKAMNIALEIRGRGSADYRIGTLHESAQSGWGTYSFLLSAGGNSGATGAAGSSGALRIAYRAADHVFTTYFDPDGAANGYSWVETASFGVAGSGGQTGNANWAMSASDTFQVGIAGNASERTVASGVVYADNFSAVPEPTSAALLMAGSLLVLRQRKRSVDLLTDR